MMRERERGSNREREKGEKRRVRVERERGEWKGEISLAFYKKLRD